MDDRDPLPQHPPLPPSLPELGTPGAGTPGPGDGADRPAARRRRRDGRAPDRGGPPAQVRPDPAASGRDVPGGPPRADATIDDDSRRSHRADSSSIRTLRSLVTSRPTQISSIAAMRAREVGAPTAADLASADAELVIARRNYVPATPLPASRRHPAAGRRRGNGADKGIRRSDAAPDQT